MIRSDGRWFDLPMYFPRGVEGSVEKRARLEKAALEKLLRDVRASSFEPVVESLKVEWSSPVQGTASIFGVKGKRGSS